jgi:tryptophan 2-monooxygenase
MGASGRSSAPTTLESAAANRARLLDRQAQPRECHGPRGNPKYFSTPDAPYDYKTFILENKTLGTIPRAFYGSRVAVIGGGLAGMHVARQLAAVGLTPVVFEADRLGGRLDSRPMGRVHDSETAPVFGERGAMRFPVGGRTFNTMLKLRGIEKSPDLFPNPGKVDTCLLFEGQPIRWPVGQRIEKEEIGKIMTEFSEAFGKMLEPLKSAQEAGDVEGYRHAWGVLQDRFEGMSFREGVKAALPDWGDRQMKVFGAVGIGSGGFGPLFPISMLEILRIEGGGLGRNQRSLPRGSDEIVEHLHREQFESPAHPGRACSLDDGVTAEIQTNTRVSHIVKLDDGLLEVNYEHRADGESRYGRPRSQPFSSVVVATTTGAMRQMGLDSPNAGLLAPEVCAALGNVHNVSASKTIVPVQSPFWQADPEIPKNIQTDREPHGVYAVASADSGQGVVYLNYSWEDKAIAAGAVAAEDRIFDYLKTIGEASPKFLSGLLDNATVPFGGVVTDDTGRPDADTLRRFANAMVDLDQAVTADWHNEPNHRGGFKFVLPDQEQSNRDLFFQSFDPRIGVSIPRVVLAGDGVAFLGGWAEGAAQTSIHATQAIIKQFGGTLPPDSPLDVLKKEDALPPSARLRAELG